MLDGRTPIAELDQLQRKARAARRALNVIQSQTRAAMQLVAQVDDELASLRDHEPAQPARAQHPSAQPQEAQHGGRRQRTHAHA